MQSTKLASEGSTLSLKPRADVARTPMDQQKGLLFFKKKCIEIVSLQRGGTFENIRVNK